MSKDNIFTSIDVGTHKVSTIMARVGPEGEIEVKGIGTATSRGLHKGNVVNVDEAKEAIRASVEKAEHRSGTKVTSAYIGITGSHITSLNNRGAITVSRPEHPISSKDIARVLQAAHGISIPAHNQVIHILPRNYTLDGQKGVKNPSGMHGFRLDVESHIVMGAASSIRNLMKCVNSMGIEVKDLVLEPLASAEAVLTRDEKEMGVVLADIGGGTTDIAVFIQGSIWHTSAIPVGGYQLTNDIAIGLGTPFSIAEEIKKKHGHASPEYVDPEEEIKISSFGVEDGRTTLQRELCQIIEERMEELLEMILRRVERSGFKGTLPAGLVLTGGTANLKGLEALAGKVLNLPVRVGVPMGVYGLADDLIDPAYATGVGILLWKLRHGDGNGKPYGNGHHFSEFHRFYHRFRSWIRA